MALILSMREGEDFFVEDCRVVVSSIENERHFVVVSGGQAHHVTDDKMVEVLPDVLISVGARAQSGLARLVIEAPRDKLILRGENYRKGKVHGVS